MNVRKSIEKLIKKISDRFTGNGLMQEENVAEGERYVTPGIGEMIRKAGAEGTVLLKNDGVLPLENGVKTAIFGRCQTDWFYVGYGSGGNVNAPYKVNLDAAMQQAQSEGYVTVDAEVRDFYLKWRSDPDNEPNDGWWGHWPMCYPEAPVPLSLIQSAAKTNEVALVVIGRAAGEDRENTLTKGSYYLTDDEKSLLDNVTANFAKTVVVIDAGNVIDMSWTSDYGDRISAIVYAWQGGMESGNAVADVLTGRVNPSGKLSDTIAKNYDDYPSSANFGGLEFNEYREDVYVGYRYFETFAKDRVLYPFGFGLSYTDFSIQVDNFKKTETGISVLVTVTNTGKREGREVVQLYASAPQGALGKPSRVLVAFAKTKSLKSGESQTLTLDCDDYAYSSFDDGGASGNRYSYVLEKGEYVFLVGNNVRTTTVAGRYTAKETSVLCTLSPICKVQNTFPRLKAATKDGALAKEYEPVPVSSYDLGKRILDSLPADIPPKKHNGENFKDVLSGKLSLDDFVATLDDEELQALTRGYGCMNAPQGVSGNAGAYGGIIKSLEEKGVRAVITTDGPAGIRIGHYNALLPCGTALACTWNEDLTQKLYEKVGEEMIHYNTDVLLGAGLNIHRNPLCGRNFEYYSEDPLVSGKFAAAFTRGIQSKGKAACPKHYACNNQEVKRNVNDSRVSERALREIYLKGFEICVKESAPVNVMTSYNKINGVWCHYNFDTVSVVLRGEWGYDGTVITDWWMRKSVSPEFDKIYDNAYRIRSRVDVLMPGTISYSTRGYKKYKDLIKSIGKEGCITRGEMQEAAKNTLKTLIRLDGNKE